MGILYPTIAFKRVTEINRVLLAEKSIKALLLDADNTLTTHNNPEPDPEVLRWLDRMHGAGMKMMIVSNNHAGRIRPFAQRLGLEYTADALKPLGHGFKKAVARLGLEPQQVAVVGDQIFTDILGGNLFGAYTILVEPMSPETGLLFRCKRQIEKVVLRRYRKYRKRNR